MGLAEEMDERLMGKEKELADGYLGQAGDGEKQGVEQRGTLR